MFAGRLLWQSGEAPAAQAACCPSRRSISRSISIGFARAGLAAADRLLRWSALLVAGPSGAIKWVDNFGVQILIYIMLAWGLNIVVGLAGLLDLGYVAFYAVGAYTYAISPPT